MTLIINHAVKTGSAHSASPTPPVVSVNGVVISRDAIARETQHHPAAKPIAAWQEAARALAVRELLLQEARRLGLAVEPKTDDAGRRETDEEALLRILAEREIRTPEPDEEVCRRYYNRNLLRFRAPDIYEAAHILFAARQDDPAASAKARRQGEAVLAELRRQPERFADLARAYSACPSAAHGGNLGQITSGQTTPEFEKALVTLAPGCIPPNLIATRYGFHIISLNRKIEGRQLPYELVVDRIAAYLRESVVRRATAQYIARLVAAAEIKGIELATAEAMRVH